MKHWCLSVILASSLLALGSCGTTEPDPTPSPSPVVTSSPVASPNPSDAALYEEAERVYLGYREAEERYSLGADYSEFPPEMAEYLSPGYLEAVRTTFDQARAQQLRLAGGSPIHTVAPARGTSKNGSVAAVATCYDARGLIAVDENGNEVSQGVLSRGIYYLNYFDGALKISDADVWRADSCDIL